MGGCSQIQGRGGCGWFAYDVYVLIGGHVRILYINLHDVSKPHAKPSNFHTTNTISPILECPKGCIPFFHPPVERRSPRSWPLSLPRTSWCSHLSMEASETSLRASAFQDSSSVWGPESFEIFELELLVIYWTSQGKKRWISYRVVVPTSTSGAPISQLRAPNIHKGFPQSTRKACEGGPTLKKKTKKINDVTNLK